MLSWCKLLKLLCIIFGNLLNFAKLAKFGLTLILWCETLVSSLATSINNYHPLSAS